MMSTLPVRSPFAEERAFDAICSCHDRQLGGRHRRTRIVVRVQAQRDAVASRILRPNHSI